MMNNNDFRMLKDFIDIIYQDFKNNPTKFNAEDVAKRIIRELEKMNINEAISKAEKLIDSDTGYHVREANQILERRFPNLKSKHDKWEADKMRFDVILINWLKVNNQKLINEEPKFKNIRIDESDIFYSFKETEFFKIERKLFNRGFLDKHSIWKNQKNELAVFIEILIKEKDFFKEKKRTKIKRFFENRYNTEIGQVFQPSKIKKQMKLKEMFIGII